jgi:hypothetical protein
MIAGGLLPQWLAHTEADPEALAARKGTAGH